MRIRITWHAPRVVAKQPIRRMKAVSERLGARRYADLRPVLLSSDAGAMRVRRAFDRLQANDVR